MNTNLTMAERRQFYVDFYGGKYPGSEPYIGEDGRLYGI